jgi:hypothetical protein
MAQLLTSLLSVLFPTYAFQSVGNPVSFFSLDEEDIDGDDDLFAPLDEEDDEIWFPGDDENGDGEFGNDEDFNF